VSSANNAARQAAMLHGKIDDLEQDMEKAEDEIKALSGKMYKHFGEAQLDSMRLAQLVEDVNSVKSSIRYAVRTGAAVVFTALFGVFVAIVSSGVGG
jgi:outer membrane murein-binding lipoprotein Lpp